MGGRLRTTPLFHSDDLGAPRLLQTEERPPPRPALCVLLLLRGCVPCPPLPRPSRGLLAALVRAQVWALSALQRVAMKLDDGASFEDESVLGRPQREDRRRCSVRNVQGAGRAHFQSRRYL